MLQFVKNIVRALFGDGEPHPFTPYDRGYAAHRSGERNPYSPGTAHHAAWERGYHAAWLDDQW